MIYYTSDLHFGHENIIKLCNRPFSSIEEMDELLITRWNETVHANDTVYILGDLIFKAKNEPEVYLSKLKGKKHLVIGNHDKYWLDKVSLDEWFESVSRMLLINTGYGNATLCHFPILDGEGRYLLHGHIHGNTDQPFWEFIKNSDRTLNVGVDINGFRPVSFEELLENNRNFKEEH